jgi:hypothetical protein
MGTQRCDLCGTFRRTVFLRKTHYRPRVLVLPQQARLQQAALAVLAAVPVMTRYRTGYAEVR